MQLRHALFAAAGSVALMLVAQTADADQKMKAKPPSSNASAACTKDCVDKGYEWAEKNKPATDAACPATSADFAAGCKHYVEEQAEIAAGPLTEDAADAAHEKAESANKASEGAAKASAEAAEDASKAAHEAAEDASKASHEATEDAAHAAHEAAEKAKP